MRKPLMLCVTIACLVLAPTIASAQTANPMVGSWVGSWLVGTTTYVYTNYAINADGTYTYTGAFFDSRALVGGTVSGSGTYVANAGMKTYTTTGNLVQTPTDGPTAYYSFFTTNVAGTNTWSYYPCATTVTLTQLTAAGVVVVVLAKR